MDFYNLIVKILELIGYYIYHKFNIHKLYVLSTQKMYFFCVGLKTYNDYFPTQR